MLDRVVAVVGVRGVRVVRVAAVVVVIIIIIGLFAERVSSFGAVDAVMVVELVVDGMEDRRDDRAQHEYRGGRERRGPASS
jgi:purine-cytosine permease-like protein